MSSHSRKRSRQRQEGRTARPLTFEALESRRLLTQATLLEHHFREDDFTLSGNFAYYQHLPEYSNFTDRIPNGTYTSTTAGHIAWTSPKDGTGIFVGVASGDGYSTAYYLGGQKGCANYGYEDRGQLEFTIDASQSQLRIDSSQATSTRFTYYRDVTPGGTYCPAPNPVPSRFFGGAEDLYAGTFNPANHTVSVDFALQSPETTVHAPAAPVSWTGQVQTDFVLNLLAFENDLTLPQGWAAVEHTPPAPPVDMIDIRQGGLKFTVDVNGKPATTASVLTPVANVRLFWASSPTDTSGLEIPFTSPDGPVGVYWNSSRMEATLEQFPSPPAGATHVRVLVETAAGIGDADLSNNSRYLQIVDFDPLDSTGGPLSEDAWVDGQGGTVLNPSDASDPSVRVWGYDPQSQLGIDVQILDDTGRYVYDPRPVADFQALAPGETASDEVYFWAVKHQLAAAVATHTITIAGVNDPPLAVDDTAATANSTPLTLSAASLLANDSDVDHGDQPTLQSVSASSLRGASVALAVIQPEQTLAILYNPETSPALRALTPGQQVTDEFTYRIADGYGGSAEARVLVTVTGEGFSITQVPPQVGLVDQTLAPIALLLTDADGDASDLTVAAASANLDLVGQAGLQVSGTGNARTLTIVPQPHETGRTWITVTAANTAGDSATMTFPLIIGVAGDRDLDGAPDAEEDAAPNGGDMNGDGLADSWQAHVASRQAFGGLAYVQVSVPERHLLAGVAPAAAPEPSGPAANAAFPLGILHYQILLASPGESSVADFRTNLATPAVNRYFQHQSGGAGPEAWQFLMHNRVDGARVLADRIELTCRDGGRADGDETENGTLRGVAALASVEHPWRNLQPEDVNNDGSIAPLDVLMLVNVVNRDGAHDLGARPGPGQVIPDFLDPSGNKRIDAEDVLQIINYLNAAVLSGEGEAWALAGWDSLSRIEGEHPTWEGQDRVAEKEPLSAAAFLRSERIPAAAKDDWDVRRASPLPRSLSQVDEWFGELGAAPSDLDPFAAEGIPLFA